MANSMLISSAKNKIIKEFIKDKEIVAAISSSTIPADKPEKLIGTHIFDYHQNPHTINTVETFITVQLHIPYTYQATTFIKPSLEIWIISHENHMKVDNIPKVTSNRNDYLSQLIDKKLNGRTGFGIGELILESNVEGSFQKDYVYRKMVFRSNDLNMSLCEDK